MYIDIEYLKEQCDHQSEMVIIMLETFIETGPEYIQRMTNDLAEENYPELRQSAHAFLSSLRILGSREIASDIATVEDKCVNLDIDGLSELVKSTIVKAGIALSQAEEVKVEIMSRS